ncbi:DUF2279 domain-containing protein [Ramlibacter tataouinensis]|uniref:DUF2279 domain-containing protein n=1 Tax=Ramlibacter tataouinensis TaxID=94132 RepID=UPI0022F3BDAE|nr:DUF2279 domain-containing protein [Ramlibacter tataouinensis]WBY01627.1 DUF2279 domain-containing protein [Ramlibacter tataouinensis]
MPSIHRRPADQAIVVRLALIAASCVLASYPATSNAQVPDAAPAPGEAIAGRSVAAADEDSLPGKAAGPFAYLERSGFDLDQRNALIIGASSAAFLAYGHAKWWDQGFGGGFKTRGEGWFGRGTDYGGTDKLGHMFTNYASVRLLSRAFRAAGNGADESVRLAAWTTIGIFTGIEVLDGFSRKWRFSGEDALMNIAGAGLGVLMEDQPELDAKFDFRFGYRRSTGSRFDPFGDYAGQRYLLMAKADGFESLRRHPVLRYLEVGIGYQARFTPGGERRRDAYVGVSLNLSRLLADGFYGGRHGTTPFQRGADLAFELVQFPAAGYVRHRID